MYTLGISAFYHDSAACLLKDAEIIAAAQEERFTRLKHDHSFPRHALEYCLSEGNITPDDISCVVFYEKPFLTFDRLLETYLAYAPKGFSNFSKAMPLWVKDKLFQKKKLIDELAKTLDDQIDWKSRLLFSEHHLSHAASAFFPSPFQRAAVLTLDGVGEWTTASVCLGIDNQLEIVKEIHFPHSLGLLYSAFTYYLGFKVNSGEYKVMGLAPYGEPKYRDLIVDKLISFTPDGGFRLNQEYFNYPVGLTMTNDKFHALFGAQPRAPESALTQREMDIAASIQAVTEDAVIDIARAIAAETGESNLCLAGGVALNCVANGRLVREKIFDDIWIQPAAGDAGGALGAALMAWYVDGDNTRLTSAESDSMKGSYLGPDASEMDIVEELGKCGASYERVSEEQLIEIVSESIERGKVVGWMQGRMEFGPRALGARSILADPRCPEMQRQLNLKIKYRESFRPFAPSVLLEEASKWFDLSVPSPYMLVTADVAIDKRRDADITCDNLGLEKIKASRSEVPAVTHVDHSARVQTVDKKINARFHKLISKFYANTGCPMLVNTSFNIRGEPIVCTVADAFRCFMGTGIDVLAIGDFILYKNDQDPQLRTRYTHRHELD